MMTHRSGKPFTDRRDHYVEVTDRIIGAELEPPCDIPNHANDLASWMRKLKEDKREIFHAAAAHGL